MNVPRIIHKDDEILVVEKPAGVPAVSLKRGEAGTLASWLLKKFPKLSSLPKGELEAGLVHRMDNDTSGIMIAARTTDAYEKLRRQFPNPPCPPFLKGGVGGFNKEYFTLVIGNPPNKGTITTPIAHHPRKKKKMVVSKEGRPAETSYRVMKRFEKKCALLKVQIKTGVRHQIRVHLASIGCPIAGDRLYQNPKKRSEDTLGLNRHFLHASKLGFTHPKTEKWIVISSDLPKDLRLALKPLTNQ